MTNPEHAPNPHSLEKIKDFERAPESIGKTERSPEESQEEVEKSIEAARSQAEHEAIPGRETGRESHVESTQHRPHLSRQESYKQTMRHVQAKLSMPEKAMSKFIHAPIVEQVSDTVGKTIARPNAILSGSVSACIFVLSLYVLARFYGFELRGSETIMAFVAGWAVGVTFDLIRSAFKRKP